ncbi:Thioredoxin [Neorhodopirellula lusitana]|uniref:Thioredoxin n=2 Tax=Neorhodopirellula lusitana TaxID=445327 RepID=A0ABY1QSI7_9BACT|nr:thioredoxin family protein [Neorhodopirellula lusitana]SMP79139.1 Thioredoxin [Neorhodopirellula lusitana]
METLEHELSGNHLSVVHFWATWNNVDKAMDAVLAAVRAEFDQEITFLCMDTDRREFWDFIRACRVLNLPALGFFRGCSHIDTLVGLQERDVLTRKFRDWIDQQEKHGEPDDAPESLSWIYRGG